MLWTREIGRGYSGFIAVGNRVYTQTQTLTAQNVVCLDADTGEPFGNIATVGPTSRAACIPGLGPRPTWNDGTGLFRRARPAGRMSATRTTDSRSGRSTSMSSSPGGERISATPARRVVEDGKVHSARRRQGASVVALDALDGSTVWTSGSEPASYCSALPITFRGRRCVVAFLQNVLARVRPEDRPAAWQKPCSSATTNTPPCRSTTNRT